MAELAYSLEVSEDDRLDQAEGLVRSYCGWHIAPSRTETVRVAGGGRVIILPSLHVTEIVSVTADGTVLADDTYDCTQSGVLTLRNCDYSWGYQVVEVEFTHGYVDPPAEVTAVVQTLAKRAIDNPLGATSYSNTDGPFSNSVTYGSAPRALPERTVLDRYRLPARP